MGILSIHVVLVLTGWLTIKVWVNILDLFYTEHDNVKEEKTGRRTPRA